MFSEVQTSFLIETLKDRKEQIVKRVISLEGMILSSNNKPPEHINKTLQHLRDRGVLCDQCLEIVNRNCNI